MAIQLPNPGLGDGQTGDNEYVMWTKVKDNFNNNSHAASKTVGVGIGQIPLSNQTLKASNTTVDEVISDTLYNCNNIAEGSRVLVVSGAVNAPPALTGNSYWLIDYVKNNTASGRGMQIAYGYTVNAMFIRGVFGTTWRDWSPVSTNQHIYSSTTASAPNVAVNSSGDLQRSTSSERYKDIITPVVLTDARYNDAMQIKPIVYRSTADADNPSYHYYSFSAEQVGAYDPAFTLWRETETVIDEATGEVVEQPLAERQAEGLNINALLAMGHAISIKQDAMIKALEARVAELEKV